jgi:hypothetical protein
MTPPVVPTEIWLLAAFDPILVAVAVFLGWKADQFGKIVIAVIAALAASMLGGWLVTSVGLPWMSPVGREFPTLMPVRTIAAALWASVGFIAGRFRRAR